MGIMRVAVCDDEVVVYQQIMRLLKGNADKYTIDRYESGEKFVQAAKKYDIIFLDIEMGQLNGLTTAKYIREQGRNDFIIFLTGHVEFMSEAFKVKAFRFLNKPIQSNAFYEALYGAEKEIMSDERILISSDGNKYMVSQSDIVFVESMGDGTCVYTNGSQYITNKTLKYWEESLNPLRFYKVHKSYLVGFEFVRSVFQNKVVLYSNQEILVPLSRRQRTEFKRLYMQYANEHAISY